MARPTKLTPDVQQKIIERLQAGSTIKATCDSVGIAESSFYLWVAIGEAHAKGETHANMPRKITERDTYSEFSEAVTRAQADGLIQAAVRFRQGMNPYDQEAVTTEVFEETRLDKNGNPYTYRKSVVKKTITHMPGDWRAAAEYLARRDPENWARQAPQKMEHTGANGGAIKHEATIILKTGMDIDEL
jgi:transposase-like protein